MRKSILPVLLAVFCVGSSWAHDMFLKLDSYFLQPDTRASVVLFNGTFEKSENTIDRDRMTDVSIVGPGLKVTHPEATQWHDEKTTSVLEFKAGKAGTYVVGVSTKPRRIDLSAREFNEYLEHDGVLDVLAARRSDGTAASAARERYSKHVKTVIQVGERRTRGFDTRLGYAIEIVPLDNPYSLGAGDSLRALVLKHDKPVPNQLVYAGREGSVKPAQVRTDSDGVATVTLTARGRWYLRLIHMEPIDDPELDYESLWATLTFEIR